MVYSIRPYLVHMMSFVRARPPWFVRYPDSGETFNAIDVSFIMFGVLSMLDYLRL